MRLTLITAKVLRRLLDDGTAPRYGMQLMTELGLQSGALYPLMARLEAAGLVTSEMEQIDPHAQERPARRYYRLTPAGIRYARAELAALAEQFRPPPVPAGLPGLTEYDDRRGENQAVSSRANPDAQV